MGSYDNLSGGYLDPSDTNAKNIKQRMDAFYHGAYPQNSVMWQQGSIDKRFKAGDQTLYSMLYGDNNYYQARRFFFNLIRRHVMMIAGFQRKNRKSTITQPINDNDSLSDDFNQCLRWTERRDGFHEYFSQAFEGALDTGFSLLYMYPDYTYDPLGDLFTDQISYNNVLIDPYWRKMDFSDCNGIWRRRWVTKEIAKSLLPSREKEIDKLIPSGTKDGRFPLQAELLNLQSSNLMTYDEFHYLDSREAIVIFDPVSGESTMWEEDSEESKDELKQTLNQQPWLTKEKKQIPTVKLCIKLNDKIFYDGPNLLKIDSYPMVPIVCYHEPDIQNYQWKIQGVVRNLRDAQFLYNMRKVIELDILQSQINSGWIYPTDVLTDEKALRQTGQGFLVPLKKGRQPSEIQRIDPPAIPQSMMELSRSLSEDITRISGVNEELLGSAEDDKAGILAVLRQGAGLTTLQPIFDKLDYSQRLYGKIRLQAMQKIFSKGKVKSILGKDPNPKFFTTNSIKYSIAVEEGSYSTTQRQMELQQLLHFREIGIPISDKSILKSAFISNKQEIIDELEEQAKQQAEAQQAQAQEQQKAQNAEIMVKYAKAKSDLAKEEELKASAIEKNAKIMQIDAEAEHKRTQADLDLVKMMMSLEEMDMKNLMQAYELAQAIKQDNKQLPDEEVQNALR